MSICICAIAKNENNYLREWVEYHKNIGISKIFLYDNNDIDGEHFEEVINDYIQSGFVENINLLRGISTGNRQAKAYQDCYKNKCNEYDWVAFIDIDEFIYTTEKNINNILNNKIYNNFNAIRLFYKIFTDNDLVKVENNNYSVINRFKKSYDNNNGKSIIRTKLNINKIIAHGSKEAEPSCNELGEYLPYLENFSKLSDKPTFKKLWINHYVFKTVDEYIKKMNRGYPNFPKGFLPPYLNLDWFFKKNMKTIEKLEYIKSLGIDYEYK